MGRSVRRLTGLSAVAAVLAAIPAAAAAVEPLDTFSVSIGGYVTRFDTRVRADGELFGGTTIDLSRDLGLDKDDMIGFLGVSWRPFARHEKPAIGCQARKRYPGKVEAVRSCVLGSAPGADILHCGTRLAASTVCRKIIARRCLQNRRIFRQS